MQAIVAPVTAAPTTLMSVVAQHPTQTHTADATNTHFSKMLHETGKTEKPEKTSTDEPVEQSSDNDVSADTSNSDQNKSDNHLANDQAAYSVAAYVAQHINAQSTAASQQAAVSSLTSTELLSQTVSPQDAAAAIEILNTQGTHDSVTTALKTILSDIQTSGVPQSIGTIVSKLVAAQPTTDGKTSTQSVALMQRALKLLQMNGSGAAAVSEATPDSSTTPNTIADATDNQDISEISASLLAGLFRAPAATQTAPVEKDKKEQLTDASTMVVITPLNAILTAQQAPSKTGEAVAMPLISTDAIAASSNASSNLDTMVPPLTLAADDHAKFDASALPEVTLPKATLDSSKDAAPVDANALSAAVTAQAAAKATSGMTQALDQVKPNDVQAVGATVAKPIAQVKQPEATVKKDAAATAPTGDAAPAAQGVATQTADGKTQADKSSDTPNGTQGQAKTENNFSVLLTQEVGGVHHSNANSAVANVNTNITPQPVTEQVQVAITRAAKDGINHMTIQLSPGDLGRVEVKMHTDAEGITQVSFTVDKPSTLDSLARSAQGLERSLQDAGVKTDAGNMQFNLRQQPQTMDTGTGQGQGRGQPQPQADASDSKGNSTNMAENNLPSAPAITRNYTVNISSGLNIQA